MGTTMNVGVYLTDEELKKYLEKKDEINDKVRALVKKEVKKWS